MDKREIDNKAEELVTKAEAGDKNALTGELNAMSIEDRIAVAREMDRLNAERRKSNADLPDIEVFITTDAGRRQHLSDIQIKSERAWYNPLRLFDQFSRTDVYDPPRSELGSGMLNQAVDGILDRNRKLAQVQDMIEGRR
ncbi:MAG TPA: hypothetical protein V6D08_19120 [Candidatus Obscuribacterales bacterium]